jgi:hypothetical protein
MRNAAMLFRLWTALTAGFFTNSNIDVDLVNTESPNKSDVLKLKEFEKLFTYPFSANEEFVIQHSLEGDYFDFFKNLGKPFYYIATPKKDRTFTERIEGNDVSFCHKAGEIAAAACCVLRTIKNKAGRDTKAWYICDLKVHPNYRGQHLPITIFKRVALKRFIQCRKGFAILMNPEVGQPKAASIFKKYSKISGIKTQTLNLYVLSASKFKESYEELKSSLVLHGLMEKDANLGFVSTSGAKDYLIANKSTKAVRFWNLLHITPIKRGCASLVAQEGADHMISSVDGSLLDKDFKKILGNPSSTATILSYGMADVDFNVLRSNQI